LVCAGEGIGRFDAMQVAVVTLATLVVEADERIPSTTYTALYL
jgi:hypothetical protein